MTAAKYTLEEEVRYKLRPLPDPPFPGLEESRRLNAKYEAWRAGHLTDNPLKPKAD